MRWPAAVSRVDHAFSSHSLNSIASIVISNSTCTADMGFLVDQSRWLSSVVCAPNVENAGDPTDSSPNLARLCACEEARRNIESQVVTRDDCASFLI